MALSSYVLWKYKKILVVHFLHSCLFGVMHKAKLFSCCIVLSTMFLSFAYFGQIVYLKFLLTCCTALPVAGSIRTNGEALVFTTIIAITTISTNCKELLNKTI